MNLEGFNLIKEMEKKNIELHHDKVIITHVELDLDYQVVGEEDSELIRESADCLAEVFSGTEIGEQKVSEPMVMASKLSKTAMYEFIIGYLNNVVHQGLCLVAREKNSGRVVGVLACEDFDPNEKVPVFDGNLEPMNDIIKLIHKLDEGFIKTVENKSNKLLEKGEYIHAFMAGARLASKKKYAIIKLFDILIEIGIERGYKGILGEATNQRSEKMCVNHCGFYLLKDTFNNPIQEEYKNYEKFNMVPEEVATACKLLYRPLGPEYKL